MKKKIVLYEKLSKKKKREKDSLKRLDWGQVKPVTVTFKDGRNPDRRKIKQETAKEWKEYRDREKINNE